MRYNAYSDHLIEKYSEKVYKIPVNIGATCPNRDGRKGVSGCIFCGGKGGSFDSLPDSMTVAEQISQNISYIGPKYHASKFIAYFQNYTNTYIPIEKLTDSCQAAAGFQEVVQLCIATRPDCVPEAYLAAIGSVAAASGKDVCIELGLQTANYHTLARINRGHSLAEFIDAVLRIKQRGFEICVHLILNLPWDTDEDAVETAKILSALQIDHIKIHSLYIEKKTKLCEMYMNGEFDIISVEEYAARIIAFLEHLSPRIVVQRLAGRAPEEDAVFCNWGMSWWKVKELIERNLEEQDTYQGRKFDYLGGMTYGE